MGQQGGKYDRALPPGTPGQPGWAQGGPVDGSPSLQAVRSLRATAVAGSTDGEVGGAAPPRAALSQGQLDTAPPPVLPF